jgi:hypothetical protein
MEVDVHLPSMSFPCYFVKQDICSAIHNKQFSEALIYFLPTYTLDKKGKDELCFNLRRAALVGGDSVTLWGRGRGKNQVMYIFDASVLSYTGASEWTRQ